MQQLGGVPKDPVIARDGNESTLIGYVSQTLTPHARKRKEVTIKVPAETSQPWAGTHHTPQIGLCKLDESIYRVCIV